LDAAWPDPQEIKSIFLRHTESDFLSQFIWCELQQIADEPHHVVRNSVGQLGFTLIHSRHFDYTIRFAPRTGRRSHLVKWRGERQIIVLRGSGTARARLLKVPDHLDINDFRVGEELTETATMSLTRDSFLETGSPAEILDIYEVDSPVLIEALTVRHDDVELYWTFDEQLKSRYAEASLTASRIQHLLEVAYRTGREIPRHLLNAFLAQGTVQVKLTAIRLLLATDPSSGFDELQRAIDSDDERLSRAGQELLDSLMFRGIETNAI
jgi:hypothetical protein